MHYLFYTGKPGLNQLKLKLNYLCAWTTDSGAAWRGGTTSRVEQQLMDQLLITLIRSRCSSSHQSHCCSREGSQTMSANALAHPYMHVLPQQTWVLTAADWNTLQARVFSKELSVYSVPQGENTPCVCVWVHPRRDKISVLRSVLLSAAASDIQTHFKESRGESFQGLCWGRDGGVVQKSTYQAANSQINNILQNWNHTARYHTLAALINSLRDDPVDEEKQRAQNGASWSQLASSHQKKPQQMRHLHQNERLLLWPVPRIC